MTDSLMTLISIVLAVIGIFVAILAYTVARIAMRHQRDTQLLAQLCESAKNCNSFLTIPAGVTEPHQKSGVPSNIVVARQILEFLNSTISLCLAELKISFSVASTRIFTLITFICPSTLVFENGLKRQKKPTLTTTHGGSS